MNLVHLEERIDSLRSDLESYGNEILSLVRLQVDPHHSTSTRVDMKSNPQNAVHILRQDLLDIIQEKLSVDREISESLSEQVEQCDQRLIVLEAVSKISEHFITLDTLLEGSDLSATSSILKDAEDAINSLPSDKTGPGFEVSSGYVCKILRSEYVIAKEKFYARLSRLLKNCVSISSGRVTVAKSLSGVVPFEDNILDSPIFLADIWKSLIALGKAQDAVDMIVSQFWSSMIEPLYSERKSPPVKANISPNLSELILSFTVKPVTTSNTPIKSEMAESTNAPEKSSSFLVCRMPVGNLLESLSQLVWFLFTEVLCGMDSLAPFTSISLSKPEHALVSAITSTVVNAQPKIESELVSYRKTIEKPLKDLEKKLVSFGFTDLTSSAALSGLIDNMNESFLGSRRREILSRAREFILADYHNIMLAAGDASEDETASAGNVGDPQAMLEQSGSYATQALQFDPCQISLASCRLLKLVHEVLKQVSGSSPLTAKVLVQSARDCIEMFLFVVPVKYADTLSSSPRMGAVFYDDCIYIAHNTTLITHQYRAQIVDEQKQVFGFVDLIPRLRAAGEKVLGLHIDESLKQISQFVAQANIQPNGERSHDAKSSSSAANNEQAVAGLVSHFSRLHDQWRDVMQEAVYQRVVGFLLESTLRQFMEPLLTANCTCITESAAADISRLFRSMQKLKFLFAATADASEDEKLRKMQVASWAKFCALADLLEYSLTDIAEWIPRKKFSSFTSQQLSNLIRALFEDTSKRQSLLTSIVDISN